jgi:hypothetical protein
MTFPQIYPFSCDFQPLNLMDLNALKRSLLHSHECDPQKNKKINVVFCVTNFFELINVLLKNVQTFLLKITISFSLSLLIHNPFLLK